MKQILLFLAFAASVHGASIDRLMEGNERFVTDQMEHPDRTIERREVLVNTQNPFAVIVGCSDSRVAPEIIFDQGIGDLFIVRVAGNVVGSIELESVHYAVSVLGSNLVLVLGHENCGAVDAVLKGNTQGIPDIAALVGPAVKGKTLSDAIKANIRAVVEVLKADPIVKESKAEVVGGYFNIATGKVDLL